MEPFVELTGSGTATGIPDVVALDLAVRSLGASVASALADADAKMARIVAAAKDRGIEGRDLQTTGAGVYPQYDREGTAVTGYQANQQLRLRVRDHDLVGPLIHAFSGIAGNALAVDNISLQVSDPGPLLERARAAAFADAEAKARQFAVLAGRELGPVLYVVDGAAPTPLMGFPARDMRMSAQMAGGAELGVEAGEHSVSTTVTVRWGWV